MTAMYPKLVTDLDILHGNAKNSVQISKDLGISIIGITKGFCGDIQIAKEDNDLVIVIVHGGREHYQLPTPKQRERFRFYADAGADFVVGHHTHCYSGYEIYKGKPIFYSLGNFIFDYKKKYQRVT